MVTRDMLYGPSADPQNTLSILSTSKGIIDIIHLHLTANHSGAAFPGAPYYQKGYVDAGL